MPGEHKHWYGVRCHKCGENILLYEEGDTENAERFARRRIQRCECQNPRCRTRDNYQFPDELVRFPELPEEP